MALRIKANLPWCSRACSGSLRLLLGYSLAWSLATWPLSRVPQTHQAISLLPRPSFAWPLPGVPLPAHPPAPPATLILSLPGSLEALSLEPQVAVVTLPVCCPSPWSEGCRCGHSVACLGLWQRRSLSKELSPERLSPQWSWVFSGDSKRGRKGHGAGAPWMAWELTQTWGRPSPGGSWLSPSQNSLCPWACVPGLG